MKSQTWIPENGDDSIFLPGFAKQYQRNSFFTLIGDVVSEDCEDEIRRGLVKPLNLLSLSNDEMEGVNSIVFKASIEDKIAVIKSLLPLSDSVGYASHFALQSAEFSIPLSIPTHPHILTIMHQFTASSVLVYPWVSKDLRDLSQQVLAGGGKGIVKRQTTYVHFREWRDYIT